MAHEVICRICKQKMDLDKMEIGEWVMPTPRFYYHSRCYDDWKNQNIDLVAEHKSEFWYESLIDYLRRNLMSLNEEVVEKQWNQYIGRGHTAKGIYFAIRYFYDIQNGDPTKAKGGIGIVPHIYNEAAEYWTNLEWRRRGTMAAITRQIEKRANREIINIHLKPHNKSKEKWSLEDIRGGD